ncbi:DUF6232 family protein [Streptomyces laculatispora]|uniref:DUF6232 family protein n=1 Tax=Streptomyces laculatispora TaxID=887464 RepID=A0ABY9I6S8_9ACTN|nr:DUF6232 family protein [Streptomyces laculatispora]WLQ42587.1 DUF6232 family protein [Streptomyces laculatispora]
MDDTGTINTPLPEPPRPPPPRPPTPPMPPQARPVQPGSVAPGRLQNPGGSNQPHRKGDPLVLKVSRRMLWVGTAAIPLHNIAWVDAFRLRHNWGAAFGRLVQWLVVAVLVFAAINYSSRDEGDVGESANGRLGLVMIAICLAVVIKGLIASAKPVLVVEMNSGSRVIVTLPSMDELQEIAGQIAHAIDNPEAEFTTVVRQVHNNSTHNHGAVIHMNGGRGNTGIKL